MYHNKLSHDNYFLKKQNQKKFNTQRENAKQFSWN